MFSWIAKKIFSADSDKVVDHVAGGIGAIGRMIDERKFTPEEESKAAAKAVDAGIEWHKGQIEQNSDRSKSRREVAKKWINFYLDKLIPVYLTAELINCFYPQIQSFVMAARWVMVTMGTGTLMVLGFFFGTHAVRAATKIVKGK